jgi:hypothetical protein
MKLPKWAIWILSAIIILIVVSVAKVNIHLGSDGFGITQGLVK